MPPDELSDVAPPSEDAPSPSDEAPPPTDEAPPPSAQAPPLTTGPQDADDTRSYHLRRYLRHPVTLSLGSTLAIVAFIAAAVAGGVAIGAGAAVAVVLITLLIVFVIASGKAEDDFFRGYAQARGLTWSDERERLPGVTPLLRKGDDRYSQNTLRGGLADGLGGILSLYTYEEESTDSKGNRQTSYFHFTLVMTDLPEASPKISKLYCNRKSGFRFLEGVEDAFRRNKRIELESEALANEYEIFGLSVTQVKRGLRVATVFNGSPAKRAGMQPGDVIVAVNGRSIADQDADAATARIKGKPGTRVRLTVVRGGHRRSFSVERAELRVPVVSGSLRRAAGEPVAYIRFSDFIEGAGGELRAKVERLYRQGAKGLVLDLRGNGGGLLSEAVLASSVLVDRGVIVTTDARSQGRRVYRARGDAVPSRPMVVLISRDTASAAEILTAALSDHDLAKVVGTRSFGKGFVQQVIELANGGALDLTIGEYLTPDGRSLAGKGIRPDVRAADILRTPPDEGLRKALAVLGRELDSG